MASPEFATVPTSPSSPSPRPLLSRSTSSPLNPDRPLSRDQSVSLEREGSSGSSNGNENRYSSSSAFMGRDSSQQSLGAASLGVLSGAVGGNFGPFPRSSVYTPNAPQAPWSRRDSLASSDVAIDIGGNSPGDRAALFPSTRYSSYFSQGRDSMDSLPSPQLGANLPAPDESLLWDKSKPDVDDFLHNPQDPAVERMLERQWDPWSFRGWFNLAGVTILIVVLVGLFAGWPIYNYAINGGFPNAGTNPQLGYNAGGINGSGQVPDTALPHLIDDDTPLDVRTRTGFDGEEYHLVFSDEFNVEGRTFWPGDDPYWEAQDIHYWETVDLEWYDPDAITTKGGKLVITMTEEPSHDLAFRSGMLQSWNKFCFTGGYIEASISLPGTPHAQGYWPGVWTMGNLGRAGFGGTNDGMWPYSYGACDVGTLPSQLWPNGTDPQAALHSGQKDYSYKLSFLPGQRASACTCPGEDHPGPNNGVGRGAPEIDIIEGQVDYRGVGSASQSIQIAPIDTGYGWKNETPYIQVWNETLTFQNQWHGAVYQESMSVITLADATSYEDAGYSSFGFEYTPGPSGQITWAMNQSQTWQLNADAMGPDTEAQISQRLVSVEPMAININLAISTKFQTPEWGKLTFPGHLYVDYIRVYQKGTPNVGCNPPDYPTTDYINKHLDTYLNPNITTWQGNPNNTWPKNSLGANGCN